MTGGRDECETDFYEYRATQNKWIEQEYLRHGRYCHATVVMSDALYVLGGFRYSSSERYKALSCVERYSFAEKKWKECGNLVHPAANAPAIVSYDKIIVLRGLTGLNHTLKADSVL